MNPFRRRKGYPPSRISSDVRSSERCRVHLHEGRPGTRHRERLSIDTQKKTPHRSGSNQRSSEGERRHTTHMLSFYFILFRTEQQEGSFLGNIMFLTVVYRVIARFVHTTDNRDPANKHGAFLPNITRYCKKHQSKRAAHSPRGGAYTLSSYIPVEHIEHVHPLSTHPTRPAQRIQVHSGPTLFFLHRNGAARFPLRPDGLHRLSRAAAGGCSRKVTDSLCTG